MSDSDSVNNPPPLVTSIPSDIEDKDPSETRSQVNSRSSGSVAVSRDDDASSSLSTDLSDASTLDLLELLRPASPDTTEEGPPPLGLNRPWGLSDYDDYDVITVHGLRDDRSTCWKSKSGKPWLRDNLFESLSIRQLDYSYATDESARIFRPGGVRAEAQNLLRLYSENRRHLEPLEVDRPVIWICHDVGGAIVKQALIEAAQPIFAEDYEDTETWELMKDIRRKISIFSTAIVFLGCPHRAETMEVLEDELHNLMGLPGPDIRKGITGKIRDLAHQVNDVNIRALEGNLFSRIANINAFYLPDLPKESYAKLVEVEMKFDSLPAEQPSETAIPELPTVPASPFSWYTLTTSNWMEANSRHRQSVITHADLVLGDEDVDKDESWIAKFSNRLSQGIYPLKIVKRIISGQSGLLSMAPPRKLANVHIPSREFIPSSIVPSFLAENKLRSSNYPIGPQFTYICGLGDSARTSMLSQYWQVFDSRRRGEALKDYGGSMFYFEFDKLDKRRNTIRSMLLTYFNEMSWRDGDQDTGAGSVKWAITSLGYYGCWSLPFLFKIFQNVRSASTRFNTLIFLACFDNCVEDERAWFLKEVLDEHDRIDQAYRLVITASDPDTSAFDSVPDVQILSTKDFLEEPRGFAVDEMAIHVQGLASSLQTLLDRRPALNNVKQALEILVVDCHSSPQLGFLILNWLSDFRKGTGISEVVATIEKLRPVTPDNVLSAFLGSLSVEKRDWAALVYRWVKYTMEPLTIEALAHALAVSTFSEDVILDDIDYTHFAADVQDSFKGVLVMDGRDVKFSYAPFQDASLRGLGGLYDEEPSTAHGEIARICLEYLMHGQVKSAYRSLAVENYSGDLSIRPLFLPREGLLEYAVQYWPEHYRLAGPQRPFSLALEFFNNTHTRMKWAEAFYLLSNPFTRLHRSYFSPIPLMAALGLEDLVKQQIDLEEDHKLIRTDVWLAITEAARHGHLAILSSLLGRLQVLGDSVEDQRFLQDTMFWAAFPDNEEVLSLLVNKDSSQNDFKWPGDLYLRAACAGSTVLIAAVIKSGQDVDFKDSQTNMTALSTAIVWDQPAVAKLVLDADANYNSKGNNGVSPFFWALIMCRSDIVQLMLEKGVNLKDKDDDGMTVVNNAVEWGDKRSLKLLIAAGADFKSGDLRLDSDTNRPIIRAAYSGRPASLRILIDSGADPLTESEGGSILHLVCGFANRVATCRYLLEKGADPNKKYADRSMTFIRVLEKDDKELTELFLNAGAVPDSFDDWDGAVRKTPLTYAARFASYEVMKLLLDHGASPNYCPDGINSALLEVALEGGEDSRKAELLLERGATFDSKRLDGWAPLQAAYDSPALVALFLKHGADVEKQTEDGTVLMMAARWGFIETLRAIVAHEDPRPDLNTTYSWEDNTHSGYTALNFAVLNGNFDCANFLLQSGAKLNNQPTNTLYLTYTGIESNQIDEMAKFTQACLRRGVKLDGKDESGNTYLHNITSSTTTTVIQILIDAGVPVDSANKDGVTPLCIAVKHCNIKVARRLVLHNARVTLSSPIFGSLLHMACNSTVADQTNIIRMIKFLINAGSDPNALGSEPYCPVLLHTVIDNLEGPDRHRLVHYLVENTDIHINPAEGSQLHPVHAASEKHDIGLFRYLIRHGANVKLVDNMGRHAIHHAIPLFPGNRQRFRIFNESSEDFLAPDNYGRTPLHITAAFGFMGDLGWFLRHVPALDLNLRDADGWTPLMWACKLDRTNFAIIRELIELGADIWAKSNDGQWSALKLAHLTQMGVNSYEVLQPPESERERIGPDGALVYQPIRGKRYLCDTCFRAFNMCFKCYPQRATMHNPDHEFIECVPADAESVQSEGPMSISHQKANDSETEENESDDETDAASDAKSGSEN
ncbi:ankyrin repeat protein [Fusarium avenaceum]|nr:ankyrin repeat protein [Fusarium avenaceum]